MPRTQWYWQIEVTDRLVLMVPWSLRGASERYPELTSRLEALCSPLTFQSNTVKMVVIELINELSF